MQTTTEKEIANLENGTKNPVTRWVPTEKASERKFKGGYGFVRINGVSAFVHVSTVSVLNGDDTTNFSCQTLMVYATEKTEKGLNVTRAATLDWHEDRLLQLRKKLEEEEKGKKEEAEKMSTLKKLVNEKSKEIFSDIEKDPEKFFKAFHKPTIKEGKFFIESILDKQTVNVISCDDDEKLVVAVSFTASFRASCLIKTVYGGRNYIPVAELPCKQYSFIGSGLFYTDQISKDDPLRDHVLSLQKARHDRILAEICEFQLKGVRKGLELAGISDLVDPTEVIKSWPEAGTNFAKMGSEFYSRGEIVLGATAWFRRKRRTQIEKILDEQASVLGVKTVKSWVESASWDPNYDNERNGGDGMKGPGNYVGGGLKTERLKWSTTIVDTVVFADNAAGNRLELDPAIESELMSYLKKEDEFELSKGWVREENLVLPENKIRYQRKLVAKWAREFKACPKICGQWRSAPQVKSELVARKVEKLFVQMKAQTLRKQGVEKELARKAAENAAEEKRVLDLAKVRKNWRQMLSLGHRNLRGFHEDALALLERVRTAQSRADSLAGPRKWEREIQRQEQEREEKEKQDARFLTGNSWGALDNLKLSR